MNLLKTLISTVKYWKDYFQSDVSIVVEDLCEFLRYCPHAFDITLKGDSLFIGLKDSYMWKHLPVRVRMEAGSLTLDMDANPRVPLNVREFQKLAAALDLWMSDIELMQA